MTFAKKRYCAAAKDTVTFWFHSDIPGTKENSFK